MSADPLGLHSTSLKVDSPPVCEGTPMLPPLDSFGDGTERARHLPGAWLRGGAQDFCGCGTSWLGPGRHSDPDPILPALGYITLLPTQEALLPEGQISLPNEVASNEESGSINLQTIERAPMLTPVCLPLFLSLSHVSLVKEILSTKTWNKMFRCPKLGSAGVHWNQWPTYPWWSARVSCHQEQNLNTRPNAAAALSGREKPAEYYWSLVLLLPPRSSQSAQGLPVYFSTLLKWNFLKKPAWYCSFSWPHPERIPWSQCCISYILPVWLNPTLHYFSICQNTVTHWFL